MIRVATVFSGIGSIEHALDRLDIPHKIVFACDNGDIPVKYNEDEELKKIKNMHSKKEKKEYVDKLYSSQSTKQNYVKKSYMANYKIDEDDFHLDIKLLDGTDYKGKVDLFVGGSPCQSFSMVGKRKGLEDARGLLIFQFCRLVNEIQPKMFIYENVKGILNHNGGETWQIIEKEFKKLGYKITKQIMNSKDYGIPQNRERLFVVGFKNHSVKFNFPKPLKLEITMKDLLEDNPDSKYYLNDKGIAFVTSEKNLQKRYTQINGDIALCEKANQQFNWHGDFICEGPKKIDDNFAMELYKVSTLNEISYFRAMTACAICGYINTALKVFEDKVNIQNISVAIPEFEGFCKRREEEHYGKNILEIESVKIIYNKLKELQNNKKIEQ